MKQTRDANRKRRPAPFVAGDLVYVSTKNMSLPRGLAWKLIPKYIGPYPIVTDFSNNLFRIELPGELKRRGIHDVFHSSLLRVHEPSDDRLFPGRLASQVAELDDTENEWAIDKLVSHKGSGTSTIFEALWRSGDRTWVPYDSIKHRKVTAARRPMTRRSTLASCSCPSIKALAPASPPSMTDTPAASSPLRHSAAILQGDGSLSIQLPDGSAASFTADELVVFWHFNSALVVSDPVDRDKVPPSYNEFTAAWHATDPCVDRSSPFLASAPYISHSGSRSCRRPLPLLPQRTSNGHWRPW